MKYLHTILYFKIIICQSSTLQCLVLTVTITTGAVFTLLPILLRSVAVTNEIQSFVFPILLIICSE